MAKVIWGLLGPEKLALQRRTRTLQLGTAVHAFNELAVPGLGNIWFAKQLFLALLGVAVAEQVRILSTIVRNIETANAIEALACWLAFQANGWQGDPRLRGRVKLAGKDAFSFSVARRRGFYVTAPMRMATVEPLLALRLVESIGERFNSFYPSDDGKAFLDLVCGNGTINGGSRALVHNLVSWVRGDKLKSSTLHANVLSPLAPTPKRACEFLHQQLTRGSTEYSARRRAALSWVQELAESQTQPLGWQNRPELIEETHWSDLHAGALFFNTRDASLRVLDAVEEHIALNNEPYLRLDERLPKSVTHRLKILQQNAGTFLDLQHDPTPEKIARNFCKECIERDPVKLLINLVRRDDRVLRLRPSLIERGPAFRGDHFAALDEEENAPIDALSWPKGISRRVRSLFLLNLDLHGRLEEWLEKTEPTGDFYDEQA